MVKRDESTSYNEESGWRKQCQKDSASPNVLSAEAKETLKITQVLEKQMTITMLPSQSTTPKRELPNDWRQTDEASNVTKKPKSTKESPQTESWEGNMGLSNPMQEPPVTNKLISMRQVLNQLASQQTTTTAAETLDKKEMDKENHHDTQPSAVAAESPESAEGEGITTTNKKSKSARRRDRRKLMKQQIEARKENSGKESNETAIAKFPPQPTTPAANAATALPTAIAKKDLMIQPAKEKELAPTPTKPKEILMTSTTTPTAQKNLRTYTNGMKSCAVLVDAENISYRSIGWILQTLDSMGYNADIRRAYGDFSGNQSLLPWQTVEKELSFQQIQAPKYVSGKNTSDAAMMIGAMDMLISADRNIETFVLVTSDSDFTPLVQRLKEAGKEVLGFGERKAPFSLINEYDLFILVEIMAKSNTSSTKKDYSSKKKFFSPPKNTTRRRVRTHQRQSYCVGEPTNLAEQLVTKKYDSPPMTKQQSIQHLANVIDKYSDNYGWMSLYAIKHHYPYKNNGINNVANYFAANSEHFELRRSRVRNRLSHGFDAFTSRADGDALLYGSDGTDGAAFGGSDTSTSTRPETDGTDSMFGVDDSFAAANGTDTIWGVDGHANFPPRLTEEQLVQHLVKAIKMHSFWEGWADLSLVATHFAHQDYGYARVSNYFEAHEEHFQLDKVGNLVRARLSDDDKRQLSTSGTNGTDTSSENSGVDDSFTVANGTDTISGVDGPELSTDQPSPYLVDSPTKKFTEEQLIQHLTNWINMKSNRDGWANVSVIATHFDYEDCGYSRVSDYFEAHNEHFQLDKVSNLIRIRLPDERRHAHSLPRLTEEQLVQHLVKAIKMHSFWEGWADLSLVATHFAHQEYGYARVSNYFEAHEEHFQLDMAGNLVRARLSVQPSSSPVPTVSTVPTGNSTTLSPALLTSEPPSTIHPSTSEPPSPSPSKSPAPYEDERQLSFENPETRPTSTTTTKFETDTSFLVLVSSGLLVFYFYFVFGEKL